MLESPSSWNLRERINEPAHAAADVAAQSNRRPFCRLDRQQHFTGSGSDLYCTFVNQSTFG
jgi:hypothetical protein